MTINIINYVASDAFSENQTAVWIKCISVTDTNLDTRGHCTQTENHFIIKEAHN